MSSGASVWPSVGGRKPRVAQSASSGLAYPGFVLFTGIGWFLLTDLSVTGQPQVRFLALEQQLYVFAAFVLGSPLGLLIGLVPDPIYDFYERAPRTWGLSALEDQQIAGLSMATEQAAVFFAIFTVFFLRFLAEQETAEAELPER